MNKKVSILLVGISGYGNLYLKELLTNKTESAYLSGVVDINPKKSSDYEEVIKRRIPIYDSMEEFYQQQQADLAIISTPIHLHEEQSSYAMNHGSHVLCEKPMASNPNDIEIMIETRNKTGKFLGIGFNWSFNPSVLQLKQDILNGNFGKPKRFKTMVQWPRNEAYYNRSAWAGKRYSQDGRMIFDSVANNATAHFLHHLLYLTGDQIDRSARMDAVTAELYCTNHIETFDTCAVQIKTKNDVDIYYYATHAVKENSDPRFILEFENATITYNPNKDTNDMIAVWEDGSQKFYKNPEENHLNKLNVCIDAILTSNYQIPCGPEAASVHVECIHAMHESVSAIPSFPDKIVHYDEFERLYWIDGLDKDLAECYTNWCLPSDLNFEWSVRGKTIKVDSLQNEF